MAQTNRFPNLVTHEGGKASRISLEAELRRTVLSCLLFEKNFYESGLSIAERIFDLVGKVKPELVVDLGIIARNQMHLRHVPLLLAVSLCKHGHSKYLKAMLPEIIKRPEELTELLSLYWAGKKTPIAAGAKKGLAKAFGNFNEYQLAKYNRKKPIMLRDVMFLVHPKPVNFEQLKTWKALANNELKPPDTWEVALSGGADKKKTFERLMRERRLGALAFLRNLRNMEQSGVDDTLIVKYSEIVNISQVLPFRFIAAALAVPRFEPLLEKMLFKSIHMKLPGKTIILVDVSGSMITPLSAKSDMKRVDAAYALAMIAREMSDDIRIFSFSERTVEVAPRHGFALRDAIKQSQRHGMTALGQAIKDIDYGCKYNRLIVVTDEQSHDSVPAPAGKGYMINVASHQRGVGYGKWIHIDGFSESIFKWMQEVEKDLFVEEV